MDATKLKPNEPATTDSLFKLASTIDQFEQYTRSHASQLAWWAEALAIRCGISGADLNAIKLAALLHDIGELAVDMAPVRATGPIDFKQRLELWRHPIIGEQQLSKRGLPRNAQLLVRWHHEWWNGFGYPDMLAGEAIPLGARILRLVDSFDALRGARPYRSAYSEAEARHLIAAGAGIEFDPMLVKLFFQILDEMAAAKAASEPPVVTAEPIEPPEPTEPTEPTESAEPTEPTEIAPAVSEPIAETDPVEIVETPPAVVTAGSQPPLTAPISEPADQPVDQPVEANEIVAAEPVAAEIDKPVNPPDSHDV